MFDRRREAGFALTTALMLIALLMVLLTAYSLVGRVELSTTRATMDMTRGFFAAEAGLNLRADELHQIFVGYNVPDGETPPVSPGVLPCSDVDQGAGDFECRAHEFQRRDVRTLVVDDPTNPTNIVVPRGEQFQNLTAIEYSYGVRAATVGRYDAPEALVEMRMHSRLIPMFQFAVFYNKDLEILPGPNMSLNGAVHTNGDLYLDSGFTLTINGQITSAGDLFHGRKENNGCTGTARAYDPAAPRNLPTCAGRVEVTDPSPWNGMIQTDVDPVTVPSPDTFAPTPGAIYWDKADLRLVLNVNVAPPAVQVRNVDGSTDAARSTTLATCFDSGNRVARRVGNFYNNREATLIQLLDVNARGLLNCVHSNSLLELGRGIDDTTEGGLVLYLTVEGPASGGQNNYGVRVRNGAALASTVAGAPAIRGLTVVSDQAVYIRGDYNSTNKKPASFLGDSINVLSNAWSDATSTQPLTNRVATVTTINAAFLGGTDVTGGAEGTAGRDAGEYNGGLENYPRFHEDWASRNFNYNGSFVSLGVPQHADGPWIYGGPYYTAPTRNWAYDTDFNDPANLPPLSPRFVYIRQDLFARAWEL